MLSLSVKKLWRFFAFREILRIKTCGETCYIFFWYVLTISHYFSSIEETRQVTISGSAQQLSTARKLINEIINEEETIRKYSCSSTKMMIKDERPLFLSSDCHAEDSPPVLSIFTEELIPTSLDEMTEVYVSSVTDPQNFFVQKVGPLSVELDKLVTSMTAFYDENPTDCVLEKVEKGDIIAAKNSSDGSYYRGKVLEVITDDYDQSDVKVVLNFADFGVTETKSLDQCFNLQTQYRKLKFQAIFCKLADIKPK